VNGATSQAIGAAAANCLREGTEQGG